MSSDRLARITEMLQREVEVRHIGSAVGLIARDGEIIYLEAVGEADPGIPMADDAIARLASVGKGFTAVAALILYERGVLGLDTPVADHIPAFADAVVEERGNGRATQQVPIARPITVGDLLTHTGGLNVASDEFEAAWEATAAVGEGTTRDLAEQIARLPFHAQPGERYEYGYYGSSYEVLAAVIEAASGQTLEAFLIEHLFESIGMVDTYFWVPAEKVGRIPAFYRRRDSELTLFRRAGQESTRSTYIAGGGAVRSTVRDMFRFGQMLLQGGEIDGVRILSPKTVDLMMTDHVGDLLPWGRGEYGWGYGGAVRRRVRDDGIGSVGTFGWNGGTGAAYWIDPVEGLVAVLLTPYWPPFYAPVFDRFERMAYASITESRAR